MPVPRGKKRRLTEVRVYGDKKLGKKPAARARAKAKAGLSVEAAPAMMDARLPAAETGGVRRSARIASQTG